MSSPSIKIIDATLREGMQAPGVSFSASQSVEIARYLAHLGVDIIECGHAAASPAELARVLDVVEAGLGVPVLVHARARKEDIYAAAVSGAAWVGIFCGINSMSLRTRVKRGGTDEVLSQIDDTIAYARSLGLKVRYTLEDASRTSLELMLQTYQSALEAGANRICFADTLGLQQPGEIRRITGELRRAFPETDIEMHLHDDRGLAMANALAAIEAGANWVSTSTNGLGERCGIVDLAVFLANLHHMELRPLTDPEGLQSLSHYVAACARAPVDDRRPVVGRHAFTHKARLHVLAVEADEMAYSWVPPRLLGRQTQIARKRLPEQLDALITRPPAIPATELRYHREGPGTRYVMIDERLVADCRQYCIVRHIPHQEGFVAAHVDVHRHTVDSLFLFLGTREDLTGLEVEVRLGDRTFPVSSPASVFIPASVPHSYRVVRGAGYYVNHVLAGLYNDSLLEPYLPQEPKAVAEPPPLTSEAIQLLLDGVGGGTLCTIAGYRTVPLVSEALQRGARVTVLNESADFCTHLRQALPDKNLEILHHGVDQPPPAGLVASQGMVLLHVASTRSEEVQATVDRFAPLLLSRGELRLSFPKKAMERAPLPAAPQGEGLREHVRQAIQDSSHMLISLAADRCGLEVSSALKMPGDGSGLFYVLKPRSGAAPG